MTSQADTTSHMSHSTPADTTTSLDNCEAVIVGLGPLSYVVVWRHRPKHLRPVERGKRIRDLRPGDRVVYQDKQRTVHSIEVYR